MTFGPKPRRPDRDIVRRIVCEDADRARVGESALWELRKWPTARKAQRRAMVRVLEETGCSAQGLADVWGCDVQAVYRAYREPKVAATPPPKPLYDPRTLERLTWQYGEARTARIAARQDFKTNKDIAAWRNLGERRPDAA